ncbi:heme peroxidase [Teladorsagia circumcincta]|uniref:Heme peroxidase n=1 Tax=Teladorsagia circumcincta TaxID=45464 RepID=A0A2G9TM82_TELCI|nr:heme peroxidase [Teladorsagia circumcincta]
MPKSSLLAKNRHRDPYRDDNVVSQTTTLSPAVYTAWYACISWSNKHPCLVDSKGQRGTHLVNGRTFPPNNRRDSMTVGDDRATIFLGLAAMHTTFLRLHNSVAATLQNMNRHWNEDRVFQETRKIVGSVIQVITYQEFLPALIGPFHDRLVPPYLNFQWPEVTEKAVRERVAQLYRTPDEVGQLQETAAQSPITTA